MSDLDLSLSEVDWQSSGFLQDMTFDKLASYDWQAFNSLGGLSDLLESVFVFEPGMGAAASVTASDLDLLLFDDAIDPDTLAFSRSGDDLVISRGTDSVRLMGAYLDGAHAPYVSMSAWKWVAFDDLKGLNLVINGTEADDNLIAPDANDWVLDGLAGNDALFGNAGSDQLDGGAGADQMAGGTGDDSFYVDDSGDKVVESRDQGNDVVISQITYALPNHVETLYLEGVNDINAIGNTLDNELYGNAGNNTLNGRSGADVMAGSLGDDIYVVDNADDVVIEYDNAGVDRVNASISIVLGDNLENLTLTGEAAIDGTGNDLDNVLKGNGASNFLSGGAGNDTLNGAKGADTLLGGTGDDVFIVDDADDQVIEMANEGIDMAKSSVDFVLPEHVENLLLTGSAMTIGFGNSFDNTLTGNAGSNYLAGLEGDDVLKGNGARDILQGGSDNDLIYGGAGANLLDGGTGGDTLSGGSGADLIIGGGGSDVITTNVGADIIVFNRGDGVDTVSASKEADNTLSLGGGITYGQLALSKSGQDLVLDAGAGDLITFRNWYRGNRSIATLQVVLDGSVDYQPAGVDSTRDNLVETFDFGGMVATFDAARAVNPALTDWALSNALADFHLSGSDTEALGGDLAYQYGKFGDLSAVGLTAAQSSLSDPVFGTAAQMFKPLASLQEGAVRLM
jgi:Ca2+-binding RTX toxin-like protein